ncbi:MAG: AMIN domain-containing protein [Candidatus Eisenbacteria bacterium]|nr:AMIN domain-containing protein [Candidatus Eisenbacteria bacterium]
MSDPTRRCVVRLGVACVLLCGAIGSAAGGTLRGIRIGYWDDRVRVVCDLSAKTDYRHRVLRDPHRIALDLPQTASQGVTPPAVEDWLLERIRLNHLGEGTTQVVLDLSAAPSYRIFDLPAEQGRPARLVCDLLRPAQAPPALPEPWVVALDPGHGGGDPGAVSRRPRLYEKEIVLTVARHITAELNAAPGVRAFLTREADVRVDLGQRVRRAEEVSADVFVSIHVNGCGHRSAQGAEVFFLSLGGATDASARELEALENQPAAHSDPLIGEIADLPFAVDLIQTDTIQRSSLLAEVMLDALVEDRLAASRGVRQANFVVLRSVRVPSVLVELGFISNPEDARHLASSEHLAALGQSLARGLLDFKRDYARQSAVGDGASR